MQYISQFPCINEDMVTKDQVHRALASHNGSICLHMRINSPALQSGLDWSARKFGKSFRRHNDIARFEAKAIFSRPLDNYALGSCDVKEGYTKVKAMRKQSTLCLYIERKIGCVKTPLATSGVLSWWINHRAGWGESAL